MVDIVEDRGGGLLLDTPMNYLMTNEDGAVKRLVATIDGHASKPAAWCSRLEDSG